MIAWTGFAAQPGLAPDSPPLALHAQLNATVGRYSSALLENNVNIAKVVMNSKNKVHKLAKPAIAPPLGRTYLVGGKKMWLDKSGKGAPAVVFLAGGGAVGLDYYNVHERVAKLTTSVIYDRLGTGWSEPVELPRTSLEVVNELKELLKVSDVPSRYILVGHSLGGLYARHFAKINPTDMAGLVLLDPAHEDYDSYMPSELNKLRKAPITDEDKAKIRHTPSSIAEKLLSSILGIAFGRALLLRLPVINRYRVIYRGLFSKALESWPEAIRDNLIEGHTSLEWLLGGSRESGNLYNLYEEVKSAGPMPDIPMIVLSSTEVDDFRRAVSVGETDSLLREELGGKLKLYSNLASSVTRGECRTIDAGHFNMHFRHPDLIAKAISDLIGK